MNTYVGTLELYTEMGEMQAVIANIKHEHPSPYARWFMFDKKTKVKIKVTSPKTREVLYEGPWTYSRLNTAVNKYFSSPEEISPEVWLKMCLMQSEVEILTSERLEAEESSLSFKHDETFDIWEVKGQEKLAIVKGAVIWTLQTGKTLEVAKRPQKWFSPSPVINFTANFSTKEIWVFTQEASYLLKPEEKTLIA